jgi:selenocysteine-specific elongation factor
VRLEEPLAPRYDDRFIVRSYSPVYTVGGGVVLDTLPPRRTTLKPHERELLDALLAHDLQHASTGLLASRGLPMTSAQVAAALGVPRAQIADELNRASLERLKVGSETYFVDPDARAALLAAVERELVAFHEAEPSATGIAVGALRDRVDRRLDPRVFDALLALAAESGVAAVERGEVRHPKAGVSALAEEQEAGETLLALVERQGLAPAGVPDLAAEAGVDSGIARKVLGKLAAEQRVVRVTSELYFSLAAIHSARDRLIAALQAAPAGLTAAELRDVLGVSRKHAIPLLEFADAQGLTKREGDVRVLRKQ